MDRGERESQLCFPSREALILSYRTLIWDAGTIVDHIPKCIFMSCQMTSGYKREKYITKQSL